MRNTKDQITLNDVVYSEVQDSDSKEHFYTLKDARFLNMVLEAEFSAGDSDGEGGEFPTLNVFAQTMDNVFQRISIKTQDNET